MAPLTAINVLLLLQMPLVKRLLIYHAKDWLYVKRDYNLNAFSHIIRKIQLTIVTSVNVWNIYGTEV